MALDLGRDAATNINTARLCYVEVKGLSNAVNIFYARSPGKAQELTKTCLIPSLTFFYARSPEIAQGLTKVCLTLSMTAVLK
jgi:hypothetical protein